MATQSARGWTRWVATAAFALLVAAQAGAQDTAPFRTTIERMLAEGAHPWLENPDLTGDAATLTTLYERNGWQPLWVADRSPTRPALAMLNALRHADTHGLRAEDYEANRMLYQLVDLIASPAAGAERWAHFDLALSAVTLRFVTHLHYGRTDPASVGFHLSVAPDRIDRRQLLQELAGAAEPAPLLAAIEPPFEHYRLLKAVLPRFQALALETGLNDLPAFSARSLKPGEPYTGAPQLRRLLFALGFLHELHVAPAEEFLLDPALTVALRDYQASHGLVTDGVLGRETFRQLTTPLAQRVRQIELTLERWRWLPRLETPPIIVNIPQFRLFAFRSTEDREADMLRMDVIVGREYPHTRTPIFTEELRYLVFRPYWDVPYSIATRELLPEIRRDPGYLDRNDMEIVRGPGDDAVPVPPTAENLALVASGVLRLRQRPGPTNALGLVKFMLPNAHNVYLHSTPARGLFREARRAFSHGCIRVSNPVGLAEQVLRNAPGEWTRERIEDAMQGTRPLRVNLDRPIRVFILYGTAIATEAGDVLFFDDLYGHDARLAAQLGS